MKILMVSIFAPHFFNWTEQLKDSGYEIYWLDVFDSNTKVEKIDFVNQITGWRYKWDYPGRYLIKKRAPKLTNVINKINERKFQDILKDKIELIKPDVVHSFVIYLAAGPALKTMENYPGIKWILSTWGSDIYYYRNKPSFLDDIRKVLNRTDYLFTDCNRDFEIAKENGFKGEFLGVFPGGGGYDLESISGYTMEFDKRDLILVKGYQGLHGRCIEVLKALIYLEQELAEYNIVVFGAGAEVVKFAKTSELNNWSNFKVLGKITHIEVVKLMGKAKVYIGNSMSDGMPNTLLEAIMMEAFPIQSNPGGVSAEIIEDGQNGVLIYKPENISHLVERFKEVFSGRLDIQNGINFNSKNIKPLLTRAKIEREVLDCYKLVENGLKTVK